MGLRGWVRGWVRGGITNFKALQERIGNFLSGWEGRGLTGGWESNKVLFCRNGWSGSAASSWESRMVVIMSIHVCLCVHPPTMLGLFCIKKTACVFGGGRAQSSAGDGSFLPAALNCCSLAITRLQVTSVWSCSRCLWEQSNWTFKMRSSPQHSKHPGAAFLGTEQF